MFKALQHTYRFYQRKKFYSAFVQEGDLCFDIGANVGEKSALLLSLGARVVALEPQSRCIPALRQLEQRYPGRLLVVQKAVGDSEGRLALHLGSRSEISTFSAERMDYFGRDGVLSWKDREEVEVTTLKKLMDEFGTPVYCKIDTEGFERKVLAGLDRPVAMTEFEFIPHFMTDSIRCIELLAKLGEARFNYNRFERPVLELPQWKNAADMILAMKKVPPEVIHGNIFAGYRSL